MDSPALAQPFSPIQRVRLPRYQRVAGYPEIWIGRPKQLILEALGRFHYLTAPQIARLAFSPTSLSYVRQHLSELYQAGYVNRLYLPVTRPCGSPLAVYCLDRKGLAYLRRSGEVPDGRFRPGEEGERSGTGLRHTLEANDFLILAHRLARERGDVSVAQMRTERELRRTPMRIGEGRRRISLIPDGWVDLHLNGSDRMSLALELDRGTHERKSFQAKVRAYCEASAGEYQKVFASASLSVLFVVTVGQGRLSQLLDWTKAALRQDHGESYTDLFRFATIDPTVADPGEVFFKPCWLRPFDEAPLPLMQSSPMVPEYETLSWPEVNHGILFTTPT